MNQNSEMTLQKTTKPGESPGEFPAGSAPGRLEPSLRSPRRWRRAAVASVVVCAMVLSGAAIAPSVLLNTGLRDAFLNSKLQHTGLTLSSGSAVGGWLTPVSILDVRLTDATGQVKVHVDQISSSRTLTGLIANAEDPGLVQLVEPDIQLTLDEEGRLPAGLFAQKQPSAQSKPVFRLQVTDAAFTLAVPWRRLPIVELDRLNVEAAVAPTPAGRVLTIEPVVLLDRAPLSEEHTEQNLALIAPVLSQSTELNGAASVSLDRIEQNLDGDQPISLQLSGTAVFHQLDARLKQDWAREVSRLAGRAVGRQVPDRLEVTRDSEVRFRVNSAGIYHEGLAFLLPDIAPDLTIQSSGIVGLDETLDLALTINLPELLPRNPIMSVLSKMTRLPFRVQVKGTVDDPQLVMPPGMSLVDQLSRNLQPESAGGPPPSIGESVGRIVGSTLSEPDPAKPESIAGSVLNIIRAAQRKEAQADGDSEADAKQAADEDRSTGRKEKRQQRKERRQNRSL